MLLRAARQSCGRYHTAPARRRKASRSRRIAEILHPVRQGVHEWVAFCATLEAAPSVFKMSEPSDRHRDRRVLIIGHDAELTTQLREREELQGMVLDQVPGNFAALQ